MTLRSTKEKEYLKSIIREFTDAKVLFKLAEHQYAYGYFTGRYYLAKSILTKKYD